MLGWILFAVGTLVLGFVFIFFTTAKKIYYSIKPVPPTAKQLSYDLDNCSLFRVLPELTGKIAWAPLGNYPTPLHKFSVKLPRSGQEVEIQLKREDLSSTLYGGNKVRTLEHQLACAAAMIEREGRGEVISIGGGGSNQTVAAAMHGVHSVGLKMGDLFAMPEAAHKDNALNLVSCLSEPNCTHHGFWTEPKFGLLSKIYKKFTDDSYKIMMPGGANVTGVIGHVGAVFELIDAIESGQLIEPRHLFLAVGSTCTISGLVTGLALARKLGKNAFRNIDQFNLNGVITHHHNAMIPGIMWRFVKFLASDALRLIRDLGGPDATSELDTVVNRVHFHTKWAVEYGRMTPEAQEAKDHWDVARPVTPAAGTSPSPWVCCTFTGKASACMFEFLEKDPSQAPFTLMWWTKSAVQPHGQGNSWGTLDELQNKDSVLKTWMNESGVNTVDDYSTHMNYF